MEIGFISDNYEFYSRYITIVGLVILHLEQLFWKFLRSEDPELGKMLQLKFYYYMSIKIDLNGTIMLHINLFDKNKIYCLSAF